MQNYEKLGVFYLGRKYNLESGTTIPDPVLYDSKDLTTHAVCVGMTGSGKTGLCLSLLEEAAIDGIPIIALDPKGDLGNLLLTFPQLRGTDFRPWIEESEATRAGLTGDEYAEHIARLWKKGLAEWGQSGDRIEKLRSTVDLNIYTPGSNAGLPLSILKSFSAPPIEVINDSDAMRDRVAASVSGLLALLGINADPIRSREHILLSNILDQVWREGDDIDLAGMIQAIQQPNFDKVGFMDLETFYPSKDRLELSLMLNNLAASPSFRSWTQGDPLDVQQLLYTTDGQPKLSVVSISHLSDSERMFFVTLILNEVLAWTRSQPGTSSLRAILYMDEVFGFFPPTANPPSKQPMLTLLKQARAFGVGIVLATQNPVDLDYKGLSNTGTWFLGRLQTERDKARVLDGLEGASSTSGSTFDRGKMEATLAGLGNRKFLMHNVHDDEPTVFQTRWALSYLRGPLTRSQIQVLMDRKKADHALDSTPDTQTPRPEKTLTAESTPLTATEKSQLRTRPIIPAEAHERFVPLGQEPRDDEQLLYRPALMASARMHFARVTYKVDEWVEITLMRLVQGDDDLQEVWEAADVWSKAPNLVRRPEEGSEFTDPPSKLTNAGNYKRWQKSLINYLYRQQRMTIWKSNELKQYSHPGETVGEFKIRLRQLVKEKRDLAVEKLRKKYESKMDSLESNLRRAQEKVQKEKDQSRTQMFNTAVSFGTSILGAVLGNKIASRTNARSFGTAMRSGARAMSEQGDITRAQADVQEIRRDIEELEDKFQSDVEGLTEAGKANELKLEEIKIKPTKSNIDVKNLSLVWLPWRLDAGGAAAPAYECYTNNS